MNHEVYYFKTKFYFPHFNLCVGFRGGLYVCQYHVVPGFVRATEKALDPWGLEFQKIVSTK